MDGVFYFGMGIWVVDSKGGSWRQSGGLSQPPWLRRSEVNPSSLTTKQPTPYGVGCFVLRRGKDSNN